MIHLIYLKIVNGDPTELVIQVVLLRNSSVVLSTAKVPLPHYATFIHAFIQCILIIVGHLKDEQKQN